MPATNFEPLPESVEVTATTIQAWRAAGYQVSEQRLASWIYLVVRGTLDSAAYKVIGPFFRDRSAVYEGVRVA